METTIMRLYRVLGSEQASSLEGPLQPIQFCCALRKRDQFFGCRSFFTAKLYLDPPACVGFPPNSYVVGSFR